MQCFRCHTPIPDGSRFCLSCGADLSDPGSGATTAAMEAAAAQQLFRLVQEEVGSEFLVERELGRGGMAIVYLATEVHLGRKVAIKVLPPDLTYGSAGAIERFKREARTAATLDHPNIIPIYRVGTGGRLFWYAMKFLEGQSLADLLEQRRLLPLAESVAILEQVASALDYAHARNVIHRDIKPANVMLDAQHRVIVTDFGIAKQLAAGSFTASGSVIGTPYYMSPEQCSGSKTLTGAADQYAVGIMTYQMLSGQLPFEGDSAVDVLAKHVLQPPPPLEVLRPGLPASVYRAVVRAMAKKPDDRFPTVAAFVQALKLPEPVTVPAPARRAIGERTTTPAPVPRPGRQPRLLPLVALAGAALAGAGYWVLNQQRASRGAAAAGSSPKTASSVAAPAPMRRDTQPSPALAAGARSPTSPEPAPPRPVPAAPPRTGRLRILGLPSGGTVLIDGQPRSGTSFELAAGSHQVRLSAPGFAPPPDTVIALAPGESVSLPFAGKPLAEQPAAVTRQPAPPPVPAPPSVLVVRVLGGWARIFVDGTMRREGTAHRDTLSPGAHRLRLERQGYVTVDTLLTLRPGETRMVTFTMVPERGAAAAAGAPGAAPTAAPARERPGPSSGSGILVIRIVGGWARLYVDGTFRREGISHRDSLPAGAHRIRLEREGYLTIDTTVTVRPGETQTVTFTLRPGGS